MKLHLANPSVSGDYLNGPRELRLKMKSAPQTKPRQEKEAVLVCRL